MKFKNIVLFQEDNPQDFFNYCLEYKLYKESMPDVLFHSRMKNFYQGKKEWQGLSACLAFIDDRPVGICLLEHRRYTEKRHTQQAGIIKYNTRAKDPFKRKFDWHFIHAGFLSFYVKDEFRHQGIAKSLLQNMEQLQYDMISREDFSPEVTASMPKNCIVVTARELASKIAKRSRLFHPVQCDLEHGNYLENLSGIGYEVQYGDKFNKNWEYFLPIKREIDLLEFNKQRKMKL